MHFKSHKVPLLQHGSRMTVIWWQTVSCCLESAKTAITDLGAGGGNNQHLFPQSSGGWQSRSRLAWSFPDGTVVKNLPGSEATQRDMGWNPGLGRISWREITKHSRILVDEDKRLVWAFWWEDWAVGEGGSCSGGRGWAQQNFDQLSADGCLDWGDPVLESTGSIARLRETSKRYAKMHFPKTSDAQCPCSWGRPLPAHLLKRPSNTHRWVWLSVLWGHCSFPGVHRFVCALQEWSLCFLQSFESSTIKIPLAFKSQIPWGIPSPFARSPGSGAWCGAKSLHKVQELLWYYFLQFVGHSPGG